ncbi:MAG: hypothetical protein AAB068_05570, partial [Pseudomonadota bacterium]
MRTVLSRAPCTPFVDIERRHALGRKPDRLAPRRERSPARMRPMRRGEDMPLLSAVKRGKEN